MSSTRQREREKYERMWSAGRLYRRHSPGERMFEKTYVAMGLNPSDSVLDIGCGTGRAALRFSARGHRVHCVDIARNCLDPVAEMSLELTVACLWDRYELPLQAYDWGYCTDVMEHLPEEHVLAALWEMRRHCRRIFFAIALFEDQCGKQVGEVLHLTVKPPRWWHDVLDQVFETVEVLPPLEAHKFFAKVERDEAAEDLVHA